MIFADKILAQKLERTEARSNAAFVEARAKYFPKSGAGWTKIAGTYAMFDGIDSPLTQTFGLGLFDEIGDVELEKIEDFFKCHDALVFHEVSPLAHGSLMPLLNKRGYRPIELSSVMFQPIKDKPQTSIKSDLKTRIIEAGEEKLWAQISAQGWSTHGEGLADFMLEFGMLSAKCPGGFPFMAELNSEPISTGMLFVFDDIALLGGASTIPRGRGLGAQSALLKDRLEFAARQGCTIAMMCAAPGSQSQRNAEKNGFRIAYTRTKWQQFSPHSIVQPCTN